MTRSRFAPLALAVGLVALAGCGTTTTTATSPKPTTVSQAVPTLPPVHVPSISGGSVAAIVNGQKVPMSTFQTLFTFSIHATAGRQAASTKTVAKQTMDHIVQDELIRQYAIAHHISVTSKELAAVMQQAQKQLGGEKSFQKELSQFGLTTDTYRTLIKGELLDQKVQKVIAPLQPQAQAPQPVAHVRHILIALRPQASPSQPQVAPKTRTDAAAKAKAEQLLKQIQHGASFAALAKANSDDPGSAARGGDLGNVFPHQTVPPFDKAAFSLPLNRPAIIHTVYGYHIIEVLSRGKAVPPANPQQEQMQSQQKFMAWLQQQMHGAKITRIAKVAA